MHIYAHTAIFQGHIVINFLRGGLILTILVTFNLFGHTYFFLIFTKLSVANFVWITVEILL